MVHLTHLLDLLHRLQIHCTKTLLNTHPLTILNLLLNNLLFRQLRFRRQLLIIPLPLKPISRRFLLPVNYCAHPLLRRSHTLLFLDGFQGVSLLLLQHLLVVPSARFVAVLVGAGVLFLVPAAAASTGLGHDTDGHFDEASVLFLQGSAFF